MISDTNFSGQRVLVVGGSSGIGNGVAHAFRQRGAEVHVWGTRPSAADYDGVEGSDLGGLQKFKDDFKAAGVGQFGSGWAWLIQDASGKLKITKTPNGANPISTGEGTPLLGVDVWEHSYYLDFRNRRPDYLSNFLDKLVNWEFVAGLLDKGLTSGQSA